MNDTIYRYKVSQKLNELVIEFARIHKLDNRHDFKEHWEKFKENNKKIIDEEQNKVDELKINKSITDIIYKSARYYYKNKNININNNNNNNNNNKDDNKEKRKYIKITDQLNIILNKYVEEHIKDKIKPSNGLEIFLREQYEIINRDINKFKNEHKLSPEDITNKIKKMYKNKYYSVNKKS